MADGLDLGFLTNLLGGTPTEGQPDQGANYNALASLLGQLAGAVAPGTIGARLGGVGAQAGQANILAQQRAQQLEQLQQFLGGMDQLTAPGTTTTGLKMGDDGGATFTGTIPGVTPAADVTTPQTPVTAAPTATTPAPVQDVSLEGGRAATTSPFFRVLGL